MADRVTRPTDVQTTAEVAHELDGRRVRSFVGLVLGRLGPRARSAVSGVFLALLVGEQTRSLFWVTFALLSHRLITWAAHPIAGRLSDHSSTPLGRRVPYIAGGLILAGCSIALFPKAGNYWSLVVLLVLMRICFVGYSIPSHAVMPETFGGSRWVRALVAVSVGGLVVGLSIRLTVIATWDQQDPSTWGPAYYLAAAYVVFAGVAIALLVREAPGAKARAHATPRVPWRESIASVVAQPNAKVLLAGLGFAIAAEGAYERAYPIYARDVLDAGGPDLAAASIASAVLTAAILPIGFWLAAKVPRKQNALWAGISWAAAAIAHLWVTELWQSVVLLLVGAMFTVAAVVSLIPFYLRILPRRGGLGQRLGLAWAPVLVAGMLASFLSAVAYDLIVRDYRVIWVISAVFGLAAGLVLQGLHVPPWAQRADLRRGWRTLRDILWGRARTRRLFRGHVEAADADGVALLEYVQDALDPYTPATEQPR